MATTADLDGALSAVLYALSEGPVRLDSDYDDQTREQIDRGSWAFRLRLDARERVDVSSNTTAVLVQAQLELLVRAELPVRERTYVPALQALQETLIARDWWTGLAEVMMVAPGTVPAVTEPVQRSVDVLWFQVAADLILQP